MTLKEFLQERTAAKNLDREHWLERVRALLNDVRIWMRAYDQLDVLEWSVVLLDEKGKFNSPALTISFLDAQITIQPKGNERRLEAVCGARTAVLEPTNDGWSYRLDSGSSGLLSPEAFADVVVKELLS